MKSGQYKKDSNTTKSDQYWDDSIIIMMIIIMIIIVIIIIIITNFIETCLQNTIGIIIKRTDGLFNRLANNFVLLNQAHTVAWLIWKKIYKIGRRTI